MEMALELWKEMSTNIYFFLIPLSIFEKLDKYPERKSIEIWTISFTYIFLSWSL